MTAKPVRQRVAAGIGVLTIDDPPSRNALTGVMLMALADHLEAADTDSGIAASVITGGNRIFASGANLRELRETSSTGYLTGARGQAWERLGRIRKPVVAAVAGFALGGGCELALACDAIVAGDDAWFGQPEVQIGVIPGAGGTQRWARAVGRYAAAPIVLGARRVSAWQGRALGVIDRVVPSECVVEAACELAGELAVGAPLATRFGKQALRLSEDLPVERALEHERTLLAVLLDSDDVREGIDAFLEGRNPQFQGR